MVSKFSADMKLKLQTGQTLSFEEFCFSSECSVYFAVSSLDTVSISSAFSLSRFSLFIFFNTMLPTTTLMSCTWCNEPSSEDKVLILSLKSVSVVDLASFGFTVLDL